MNLTPEKVSEIEKSLVEMVLTDEGDKLIEAERSDYYEKILFMSSRTRGWCYYTEKVVAFVGGFGATRFSIPYNEIKKIERCRVSFFPMGIKFWKYDEKKGKDVCYKIAASHRKNILELLASKVSPDVIG